MENYAVTLSNTVFRMFRKSYRTHFLKKSYTDEPARDLLNISNKINKNKYKNKNTII